MSFVRNITPGIGLTVSGGSTSMPYINMSNTSAGTVRYNANGNNLEVYDGSSWIIMHSSQPMIALDSDTQSLLAWARQKRNEEQELERLSLTNPAIKDLADKVKLYQDQMKMVQTLIKKEVDWGPETYVQSAP